MYAHKSDVGIFEKKTAPSVKSDDHWYEVAFHKDQLVKYDIIELSELSGGNYHGMLVKMRYEN